MQKFTEQELRNWIGSNIPDDLTQLNFVQMFQDFQEALETLNNEPSHPNDSFCPTDDYHKGKPHGMCEGCGHYLCQECVYLKP